MSAEYVPGRRRRFTVREYYRMADAGVFAPDERVELIEGEIVQMTPVGSRHAACVRRLNAMLSDAVGQQALVSVQNPLRLDDGTEPQPDVALLRPRDDFYADAHPGPEDTMLVVEVADATVLYDRNVKRRLYAHARIPEFWLVDLTRDTVVVHTEPRDDGYARVEEHPRGASWSSPALEGREMRVDGILG